MKIFAKNEKEKEMLNDYLVHTLHDIEAVVDLYKMDEEANKKMRGTINTMCDLIDGITISDTYGLDAVDIMDRMIVFGLSDEDISKYTGIDKLTVKRCRMRTK